MWRGCTISRKITQIENAKWYRNQNIFTSQLYLSRRGIVIVSIPSLHLSRSHTHTYAHNSPHYNKRNMPSPPSLEKNTTHSFPSQKKRMINMPNVFPKPQMGVALIFSQTKVDGGIDFFEDRNPKFLHFILDNE